VLFAIEVLLDLPSLRIIITKEAMYALNRMSRLGISTVDWTNAELKAMPNDWMSTVTSLDNAFEEKIMGRTNLNEDTHNLLSREATVFYTDGWLKDGKAGAGVFSKNLIISIYKSLGRYVSVFQAEVHAITCALDEISKLSDGTKVVICSDSRVPYRRHPD